MASAPPFFLLAFNFVRSDCGVRGAVATVAAVADVDAVAAAAAATVAADAGVAAVGICKPSFSAIASKYSFRWLSVSLSRSLISGTSGIG